MTDRQAALAILVDLPGDVREAPLARFYEVWRNDPLVLDKWFTVQAMSSRADTFDRVAALARHPDFTLANPNRARALIASFAIGNPVRFHAADGRPYAFLADVVLELDRAIRSSRRGWRGASAVAPLRAPQQAQMRAQLCGSRARSRSRRTSTRSRRARSSRGAR
jgi:hypothetical protein